MAEQRLRVLTPEQAVTDVGDPASDLGVALSATYVPRGLTAMGMPSGFGWDTTTWPITVHTGIIANEPVGSCSISPRSAFNSVSTAFTAPASTFYVNGLSGVDSTGTGTEASPWKSIWKAVAAANATTQPCKIIVVGTWYSRFYNFNYNGGTELLPAVDIAFVARGGRANVGTWDTLSSVTLDGTYTNCYKMTVSTVNRVLDLKNLNRKGNYVELTNVSTAARCNITPNSWTLVSGVLYINRGDGVAVTDSNTRVLRGAANNLRVSADVSILLTGELPGDGFDIEGGTLGTARLYRNAPNSVRVFAAENSTFKYGGGLTTGDTDARGVSLDAWQGLAVFENCTSDANQTDGFNAHNVGGTNASATSPHMLTINCSGFDNGRSGNASCNGITAHENCVHIDIAGKFEQNHGGSIAYVGAAQAWIVTPKVVDDGGDIALGGTMPPTAFYVDGTAEVWVDSAIIDQRSGTTAYRTMASTSKIHVRGALPSRFVSTGAGTIDTY